MMGLSRTSGLVGAVVIALSVAGFGGCKSNHATVIDGLNDDVEREVTGWGLRKLETGEYPDMRSAWADKTNLERAIDKSLQFLGSPGGPTSRYYPGVHAPEDTITHDQILATLLDIKEMMHKNYTPEQFQQEVVSRYDVYTSKGYNDKGDVWFTGYYTPIYHGSMTPTSEYKYPVYKRPDDLVSNPVTGDVGGQRMPDGSLRPYPTRKELESSGKLRGLELCYFKDPMEPYIIQVQGSAKVILPDGKELMIGFAGKNGRQYRGLGSELVKDGKIDKKHLSLSTVLDYFRQHPEERQAYIDRSESFVFLKPYSAEWPAGMMGVQVTADRSLATDKSIFPRASMCFIDVPKPGMDGEPVPYKGLVLDQDTGGAIRAAGRADIYMGIGDAAGQRAGREFAQGRLYYIFLKPQNMNLGKYPDLKKAVAPKVTPGTPAKKGAAPSGGDEMFPGSKR